MKLNGIDRKLLDYLSQEQLASLVFQGNYGLEKENVRVDAAGRLALTPHPRQFGDKLYNPYIKTDFSESQIEMVTPVCSSLDEAYVYLENLNNIVSESLDGEYLWPQSNPPILPEEHCIPIAVYANEGIAQQEYREGLARKYGRKRQLFSGIHYNFSFREELLEKLYRDFSKCCAEQRGFLKIDGKQSYQEFKNNVYLKITRNFLMYRWFLIYLTGASPVFHPTLEEKFLAKSEKIADESYYFRGLNSMRNSKCGYKNEEDFIISYESLAAYTASIQTLIDSGRIASASEFYSPIRLKGSQNKGSLDQLQADGIKYLELRFFDLNPFCPQGVLLEDLALTNLFLIYLLIKEDKGLNPEQQKISHKNHDLSTIADREAGTKIYNASDQLVNFRDEALRIITELEAVVTHFNYRKDYFCRITAATRTKILDPKHTYAQKVVEEIKQKSYTGFHLEQARIFTEASSHTFNLIGYEDLELSTQILIKDALKRGISFEILDRPENFIRLSKGNHLEYVKQATKTSRDAYSTVLIMENKVVTKAVLREHGLRVPGGEDFHSLAEAKEAYCLFKGKQIVIKPKSTNYGLGISIFKEGFTAEEFSKALEIAFQHDQTVLVEEFVTGNEYRFLVIANQTAAVLHRVPANVKGDGRSTIRELVREKNKDLLRGVGHKTPLEKIDLGEVEELFLHNQGKKFEYIPKEGELVYLRENSNISTGGDSIDYTELVLEGYKQIAVKAAAAVGAAITGVDMLIEDIAQLPNEKNYAIIELNFNPAIHMHCYPYQGKRRRVSEQVLDLLFEQ